MSDVRDAFALKRWRDSLMAREGAPAEAQETLGPIEHGLYAESRVREHPIWGPIEQLAAVPGYTAVKKAKETAGIRDTRSRPSVHEMAEGYRGIGRGMAANFGDLLALIVDGPPIATAPDPNALPPISQSMTDEQLRAFLLRNRSGDDMLAGL